MDIEYIKNGDYFIPNIVLPPSEQQPIRKFGRMRMAYLKEHRPIIYNQLILSGKLYSHLIEIEQTCQERLDRMIPQMKEAEGVSEALKAADQMEWVRRIYLNFIGDFQVPPETITPEEIAAAEG